MQNIVNHVCSLNFASCMTIINHTLFLQPCGLIWITTQFGEPLFYESNHGNVQKSKIFRSFGTYFSDCFYKDLICKFEKDVLYSLQKKDGADYSRFCRILYQACHLTYQLKVSSTYLWLAHPTNHRTRFRIRCSDRSVNLKSRDKPDIFLQGLKLIL